MMKMAKNIYIYIYARKEERLCFNSFPNLRKEASRQ